MKKIIQLKHIFFVLMISLLAFQCAQDTVEENSLDNRLQTVNANQALDYFNSFKNTGAQQRNTSEPYVTVFTDYISNADINNSDEMLTVLPAVTKDGDSYSRVLLLNIDGQIESVVYSMFSSNDFSTENFYGEILITDLDGNFINGYIMEDGYYVAQYTGNNSNSTTASRTTDEGQSTDASCECPYSVCEYCELEAVQITVRRDVELGNLYTSIVPEEGNFTAEIDAGPSAGGGGGGTDLNANTCASGYIKNDEGICVLATEELCLAPGFTINEEGECVENPLLGADCASFEYHQPPGADRRACAVKDFTHRFYSGEVGADGSFSAGYVESHWDVIYFTMPIWMTNGQAANNTALAVTSAIFATDAYFIATPDASADDVGREFRNNLISAMRIYQGGVTATAPYPFRHATPYLSNFMGAKTNCD